MKENLCFFQYTPSAMPSNILESMFVQRENLVQDLVKRTQESAVTSTKSQTLLIGSRGLGKTHILTLVYNRLRKIESLHDKLLIAWLREDEPGISSFLDLLICILKALQEENLNISVQIEEIYNHPLNEAELIATRLLKEIIGDRTLFLMMENLDDLFDSLQEQGQQKLYAFIESSARCTTLATVQALFDGVSRQDSGFFDFFRIEKLEKLTLESAVQLLINIARLRGQSDLETLLNSPVGKARTRVIDHFAGGNPRIYVILAELLTYDAFDRLVELFVSMLDELTPYYQARMRFLPAGQRKLTTYLLDNGYAVPLKEISKRCFMSIEDVDRELKELMRKGYVSSELGDQEKYYEIKEPLMRLCHELRGRREPIRIFIDFLRLWYTPKELEERYLHIDDAQEKQYILAALSSKEESAVIKNLKREFSEYFDRKEFEKALERAKELVFQNGNASDYFLKGLCCSRLKNWPLALESFQQVIEREENHLAWFNKGLAWIGLKNYREALRNFGQAIEIEPTFAPAWNKRDWILDFQGKHKEILKSYQEELRRDPENKIAWTNKCWVYSRLGKYKKAQKACEKALEIDDKYPMVWNNLGDVYQGMRDLNQALECYERAIKLDANCVYAILNRVKLLFRLRRWDDGIGALVKGLACNIHAEEPYTGDVKEFIHSLFDERSPARWENYASQFFRIYEENNVMLDLGLGLTQTIPCILSPSVDELEAISWQSVWVRIVGNRDEFSIPLRLLDAAITLKQHPEKPLISLKLSIEERELFKNLQKEACALNGGKTNVQE